MEGPDAGQRMVVPRKMIQILVYQNVLMALTDTNEIWMLHGLQAQGGGTEGPTRKWVALEVKIPDLPDAPQPLEAPSAAPSTLPVF